MFLINYSIIKIGFILHSYLFLTIKSLKKFQKNAFINNGNCRLFVITHKLQNQHRAQNNLFEINE